MAGGELDRLITVQQVTVTVDDWGGQTEAWADLLTCWAKQHDLSDAERHAAAQTQSSRLSRFTIRESALALTITAKDRLSVDGNTYSIHHIKRAMGSRRGGYLEITAGMNDAG